MVNIDKAFSQSLKWFCDVQISTSQTRSGVSISQETYLIGTLDIASVLEDKRL